LPACYCQPAVFGGFIYADLWGELSTHLSLQDLFTQSSPVRESLPQAFPFPSTLGEVTHCTCFLRPVCLFITHMGCGSSPLSCGVFLPPLLVAGRTPPLPRKPLWPAWLVYLQFQEGFPSPILWCSVRPTIFPMCLY
jgi:hypothetical protein